MEYKNAVKILFIVLYLYYKLELDGECIPF